MFPDNNKKPKEVELKISWHQAYQDPRPVKIEAIFQNGETIAVKFSDGTVVKSKPMPGDTFDAHTGVAMCIAKKFLGSRAEFQRVVNSIKVQS